MCRCDLPDGLSSVHRRALESPGGSARRGSPARRSAARAIRRATVTRLNCFQASASSARALSSARRWATYAASSFATASSMPSRVRNRPTDLPHQIADFAGGQSTVSGGRWSLGCRCSAVDHDVTGHRPRITRHLPISGHLGGRRILLHRDGRARTEHESFEQRVAGEPVGAVDARAGHLAGGEQSRDGRASPSVGLDAAHDVVRGRSDRNRIGRQVEVDLRGTCPRSSENGGRRSPGRGAPATGTPTRPSFPSRGRCCEPRRRAAPGRRPGDSGS